MSSDSSKPFARLSRKNLMTGAGVVAARASSVGRFGKSSKNFQWPSSENTEESTRGRRERGLRRKAFSAIANPLWFQFSQELEGKLEEGKPPIFSQKEISQLLRHPHGDSLLQIAASEAIEQIVQWKQISQFIDKFSSDNTIVESFAHLKTKCSEVVWLWKHKLYIVSCISNARKM